MMNTNIYPVIRPDPDVLLKKIRSKEDRKAYGQLKIFLGAAAGVGKTYAMLKATSTLLSAGVDVVIGYIETHARVEVEEIIPANVEFIPLKLIEYKGNILKELDVDAVIKRKPHIVIIDELAHSNVHGSRNIKRYQDVLEILNAGISVYTALNIQHIESLSDIAAQITQIKITETVPDQIIEDATEVVLIDLPPEELIERISEGKVYPKERVAAALNNFFRKGNLTALREMALRKTAQKVDQQVLEYRSEQSISDVWASNDKLLLLLELGYSTEKTVRSCKIVYDKGFSQWFVGYVENMEFESKSMREKQKMLDLIELARSLGATPVQLIGSDRALAIANCVKEQNINTIMLAQYKLPLYYKLFGKSLADQLRELLPEINLHLVSDESPREHYRHIKAKESLKAGKVIRKCIMFFILFTVLGIVLLPLREHLSNENIIMFYLLAIVLANRGRGKLSAFIAALIATLSFDFFFVQPYLSFAISDLQYLVTFIAMAAIGVILSVVNGNLRYQLSMLNKQQQHREWLSSVNEVLAQAMIQKQVEELLPRCFIRMFKAHYMLLLPNVEEDLELKSGEQMAGFDPSVADWVFNNNQSAGLNTNTFSASRLLYLPVLSRVRSRGVLVIQPRHSVDFFLPETQDLLENFIRQLAITLERIHFTQIAIQTEVALALQLQHGSPSL